MGKNESLPMMEVGGCPTFEMPELTNLNRLPMQPTWKTVAGNKSQRWDLNGEDWKFHYTEQPLDLPATLPMRNSGLSFKPVVVPGHWTLQGYDYPHYTNVQMPFDAEPPRVPERNPTGVYVKNFQVPKSARGRRMVLHVGGAESVLYVYLNGQAIGMNKDTRLGVEFDVTEALKYGATNRLVLVVVKWSDASYVEDQDQWWLGGLYRDVYLYSTPKLYIEDIKTLADYDPERGSGQLDLSVQCGLSGALPASAEVTIELLDPKGRKVWQQPETVAPNFKKHTHVFDLFEARLSRKIRRVTSWSAEDPALYTLRVTLKSRQVAESVELKIGFRRVEMRDGCFWVNGVKVMFKGVNRHEHDERTGKVISRQSMIRDIELMKQSHINAVRTAHYPDHPLWYQLCDEYGLYVIDEANIESHAFHNFLCKDQRYAAAWLERVKRMVLRDRNHVCIVMWSLGNESGYGPNHDAAAGWLRHEDPSRPLHYEGAISKVQSQRDWWSGELATDVICPMYPEIAELEEWMETPNRSARPVILCEYSHAMGNSNGCLKEYWDLFYRYREQGLQGGFIWEWVDHGLCKQGSKGQEFWAYGGDFGDEPHDGNFVCDGLVWPDRKPHPALEEVKYLHRPVAVTRVNRQQRQVTLENQQDFNSLTDFRGSWVLEVDGKAVQTGKLPRLYAKPHQRQDIKIPWNRKRIPAVGDVCLRLTFQTVSAKAGVPRGFTAVVEQVILQKAKLRKPQLAAAARKVQITETRSALRVNDGRINAAFNPKTGGMKTLQRQGVGQLTGAPMVQIWRAPTDNDGIKIWSGQDDKNLGRWLKLGLDRIQSQLESCKVSQGKHGVEVTVASRMSGRGRWDDIQTKLKWRFTGSGVVRLEGQVQLAEALLDCPQVAVVLPLEKSFDQVQWFGLGPGENYPDRKSSAVLGQYRDQVGQMFTPYIMPQENGRRGEVRTLLLRSSECGRLSVQGDQRFGFSAIPYSTAELTAATHLHQLPASSATWLTLDVAHRGIGTQSCGPDTLDQYKLKRSEYRFGFTFSWKA